MINFTEIGNRTIENVSPMTKNLILSKNMLTEISCFIENEAYDAVVGEKERGEFVGLINKAHDILDRIIVYTIMTNFAYKADSTTI